MNFLFSQYLTRTLCSLRYISCYADIKVISSCHRVISSINIPYPINFSCNIYYSSLFYLSRLLDSTETFFECYCCCIIVHQGVLLAFPRTSLFGKNGMESQFTPSSPRSPLLSPRSSSSLSNLQSGMMRTKLLKSRLSAWKKQSGTRDNLSPTRKIS